MRTPSELKVTSHISRDLLSSAAVFKTEAAVVWEYVVNSLEYVDRGVSPKVQVDVNQAARQIIISDNGQGMTASGLQHFFTMHAENLARRAGRPGRGKFGTGKSAAFGIATDLRVDTTKDGLRNVVILTREVVDQLSGEEIPVDWAVRDEQADGPNGTTVTVSGIFLNRIRTAPIIEYIERHLQAFRVVSPEVAVNSHICAYREPEIKVEHTFKPLPAQAEVIGDVELVIKVARAPLPEGEQGIAVTAGLGNFVAVERGGIETKEFGSYLFGEVDVPAIETSESKIAPYDSSRSLQLNAQHPVVAVLVGFIGSKLEYVRAELVREAKEARKTEEVRRLAIEADRIADILNEDYRKVVQRLQQIHAASSRPGAAVARFGDSQDSGEASGEWVRGTQQPGNVEEGKSRSRGRGGAGREAPNVTPRGEPDAEGSNAVDPAGGTGNKRARARGGFRVEYQNLGKNEERSRYDSATLTILINLDHAVVSAALGDGKVEDRAFRRLSYEIAFSEYAMGLGYEIFRQDPNIPADDLLYEVRSCLNRIAASAAALYR